MDGISQHLQRKFERVLLEAKDAIIETILAGWDRKTPLHFSQIEAASHRLATRWSCCFQEWAAREMTAESPDSAACPTCGEVIGRGFLRRQGAAQVFFIEVAKDNDKEIADSHSEYRRAHHNLYPCSEGRLRRVQTTRRGRRESCAAS